MKGKEKIVFENLCGGDIFVLREKIENEAAEVFVKLLSGFAGYHNAVRMKDGWPHMFPAEIEVIKLK